MFDIWLTTISSHDARWRKTKVFFILKRHKQLSNSWWKCLTWSLKLSMKNSLLLIKLNCNENVVKQSTNTQWKWRQIETCHDKRSQYFFDWNESTHWLVWARVAAGPSCRNFSYCLSKTFVIRATKLEVVGCSLTHLPGQNGQKIKLYDRSMHSVLEKPNTG